MLKPTESLEAESLKTEFPEIEPPKTESLQSDSLQTFINKTLAKEVFNPEKLKEVNYFSRCECSTAPYNRVDGFGYTLLFYAAKQVIFDKQYNKKSLSSTGLYSTPLEHFRTILKNSNSEHQAFSGSDIVSWLKYQENFFKDIDPIIFEILYKDIENHRTAHKEEVEHLPPTHSPISEKSASFVLPQYKSSARAVSDETEHASTRRIKSSITLV